MRHAPAVSRLLRCSGFPGLHGTALAVLPTATVVVVVGELIVLAAAVVAVPPPPHPLVKATQKSQINTVPMPTVAWTRPEMPRFKKRGLHGDLVQERGI